VREQSKGESTADTGSISRLLSQVSTISLGNASPDEAMRWAVGLVCRHTGWPLGHVWVLDTKTDMLVSTSIWHNDEPDHFRSFVELSSTLRFRRGEDLPGLILSTGKPLWLTADQADHTLPRVEAGWGLGIRGALGFPIISARGIEGVMEFFATAPTTPDREQLELIAHVGVQAGRVLERTRARRQLEEAERLAQLGSWTYDVLADLLMVSPELYIIHGREPGRGPDGEYKPEPVSWATWMAMLHPDDRPRMLDFARILFTTSPVAELEYRVMRGRSARWVHTHAEVVERRGGRVVRLAGFTQDVTARRRAEDRRKRAQREIAHQQRVLEQIARGEPLVDTLAGLCRHVERRHRGTRCAVLGLERAVGMLQLLAAPTLAAPARLGLSRLRAEADIQAVTARYGFPAAWSHPLSRASGEQLGVFVVLRQEPREPTRTEIRSVQDAGNLAALAIERSSAEAALLAAANLDSLTGLPNRARFLELVDRELPVPGRRVTLLFLDLDRFKVINDSLGHPAGDRILAEIAERLQLVVGDRGVLGRFGGDEFTLLLVDTDPADVTELAESLRLAIEEPIVIDGGEFFLSVSIGVAGHGGVGITADDLVRDADVAMYAAKARGTGRLEVFDQRLRTRVRQRLSAERDLRRAIECDELLLHYQPVLDVKRGRWAGVEALVRWQHPSKGLVFPDTFIPLAEETGLIVPLGAAVIEMVVTQAAAWASRLPDLHIAANISVLQLADPEIAAEITGALTRRGLPPSAIVVEVTESAVMVELDSATAALTELMARGVRVLIDDFGTGYSSIARLGELPIGGVKIDRRFTAGLGRDPSIERVLSAMTHLARAYGLDVVAEGIEDEAAMGLVTALGCDFAQGFHLGRPARAATVEELLRRHPAAAIVSSR
jgi:diguanylate cyclase (GGDEF)-like protein